MGFVSYFEDITGRFFQFQQIIEDHNNANNDKIDITDYLDIRRDIQHLMTVLEPYIQKNIDIIENKNLNLVNENLKIQLNSVKTQKDNLVKKINEFGQESQKVEKYLIEEIAVKQKFKELEAKNNLLSKIVDELELSVKKMGDNYSDLLLDYDGLFKQLAAVIKTSNWASNREKINEIEALIKIGIKKI